VRARGSCIEMIVVDIVHGIVSIGGGRSPALCLKIIISRIVSVAILFVSR